MYVPYSMDDSEPDLHCGMGGHRMDDDQDLYSSINGRDGGYGDPSDRCPELPLPKPPPMYSFASEQEMVASEVFQRQLGMVLKHKEREIHELRLEILTLHERIENMTDPEG